MVWARYGIVLENDGKNSTYCFAVANKIMDQHKPSKNELLFNGSQ